MTPDVSFASSVLRHPWREGPYRALQPFSVGNPHPEEPDRISFRRGDILMLDGWERVTGEELIHLGYVEEVSVI